MFKSNKTLIKISLIFLAFSQANNAQEIDQSVLSNFSEDQISTVLEAYNTKNLSDTPSQKDTLDESIEVSDTILDANIIPDKKFGYDFFSTMATTTTAFGDLPLPNDYKISLRDELSIILTGSKDEKFDLTVKLDGTILFPELGSISVIGKTFEDLKDTLSLLIEQSYIGVNIDVSIKNLSAKKITIVGAVKSPGTYLVNPYSTITSALAYSGGISEIGTLRNIQLIRNDGSKFDFDLYDLLIFGDRSNDITIEAGDTILINAAKQFVNLSGEVPRPAIYEVLETDTLNDLIDFALGFKNTSNKSNISLKFQDFKSSLVSQKIVDDLDVSLKDVVSVNVFRYIGEEKSSIQVSGAVSKPGFYSSEKYTTLDLLINDLEFVNTYPWIALLENFDKRNLERNSVLFSLKDSKSFESVPLLPNSKVYFFDLDDILSFSDEKIFPEMQDISKLLIEEYSLNINYKSSRYALPVFGNFLPIEVINLIGVDLSDVEDEVIYINPTKNVIEAIKLNEMNITAEKFNTLTFRAKTNDLIDVRVDGAVLFPGIYTLKSNSTLYDLYQVIGKFKENAFLDGIILTNEDVRLKQINTLEKSQKLLKEKLILSSISSEDQEINERLLSLIDLDIDDQSLGRVSGDFRPESDSTREIFLSDGDAILVPYTSYTFSVVGEVLNPSSFSFIPNLSLDKAIEMAGGTSQYADKKNIYIIKPNGTVQRSSRNIFASNSSKFLQPGDTVIVPINTKVSNSLDIIAPITQVISNLAFSAAALDNIKQN